jgi:hypothetical protein
MIFINIIVLHWMLFVILWFCPRCIVSYENATKITEAKIFNFAFMYIGDIRSINNPDFANWIPLIYPQRTWDKGNYRNMVLHDITSNDTNGQPSIRRYDKGDDYNFAIINCPHLDSNIPTAPAYGVYISQLVLYKAIVWHNSEPIVNFKPNYNCQYHLSSYVHN